MVNWKFIIGTMIILKGILWIHLFIKTWQNGKEIKKYMLYGLIFNPGLFCIFLGLLIIFTRYSFPLSLISCFGLVLSILISLPIFILNFIKKGKDNLEFK